MYAPLSDFNFLEYQFQSLLIADNFSYITI